MRILKDLIELIFPNQCLFCKKIIDSHGKFCPTCWKKMHFLSQPACTICFEPFEFDIDLEENLCGNCIKERPIYHELRAVLAYNEEIADLIADFKYRDQTILGKYFAQLMQNTGAPLIEKSDFLIPIPLFKTRLRKRGYNQAAILSKIIAKNTSCNFLLDGLIRVKDTIAQAKLKKSQRLENVKKAFAINEKYHNLLKDKNILLIDDVVTTGATVSACAAMLYKVGAKKVRILAIAKTIKK